MIILNVEAQAQAKTQFPQGYEIVGATLPLSMLTSVAWRITEAYDQRQGRYGVLIHDRRGAIAFLSTLAELDALCAMIEWCINMLSYWPMVDPDLIEQWRSIWWMVQTVMQQQRVREVQG